MTRGQGESVVGNAASRGNPALRLAAANGEAVPEFTIDATLEEIVGGVGGNGNGSPNSARVPYGAVFDSGDLTHPDGNEYVQDLIDLAFSLRDASDDEFKGRALASIQAHFAYMKPNLAGSVEEKVMNEEGFQQSYVYTRALAQARTILDSDAAAKQLRMRLGATLLDAAMELHDQTTAAHQRRVGLYAFAVGKYIEQGLRDENPEVRTAYESVTGMTAEEFDAEEFGYAGWMHDIGKMLVSGEILNKPGKLSPCEWVEMEKNPIKGVKMGSLFPIQIQHAIGLHHADYDPRIYTFLGLEDGGRMGRPLIAMAVEVCDVYDVRTNARPYSPVIIDHNTAMDVLFNDAGRNILHDASVVLLQRAFTNGLAVPLYDNKANHLDMMLKERQEEVGRLPPPVNLTDYRDSRKAPLGIGSTEQSLQL